MEKDIEAFTIKIRGYQMKKEDLKRGILTLPEKVPEYIDLFELKKKDIHVI